MTIGKSYTFSFRQHCTAMLTRDDILSIRPSVRPSVTLWYCVEMA